MRKYQVLMNKLVYLGLSILDLCKTVIYELWHDYVKPRSFIVYVKTDDNYQGIAEDVEMKFDTSNFELGRPLPK